MPLITVTRLAHIGVILVCGDGKNDERSDEMVTVPWSMSASLENVIRGGNELPEVASLEACVRAWVDLDEALQVDAELVPEHAFQFDDDGPTGIFRGAEIQALVRYLPT